MKKLEVALLTSALLSFGVYGTDTYLYPELITDNSVEKRLYDLCLITGSMGIGYTIAETNRYAEKKKDKNKSKN